MHCRGLRYTLMGQPKTTPSTRHWDSTPRFMMVGIGVGGGGGGGCSGEVVRGTVLAIMLGMGPAGVPRLYARSLLLACMPCTCILLVCLAILPSLSLSLSLSLPLSMSLSMSLSLDLSLSLPLSLPLSLSIYLSISLLSLSADGQLAGSSLS